jgi:hypothetical protein
MTEHLVYFQNCSDGNMKRKSRTGKASGTTKSEPATKTRRMESAIEHDDLCAICHCLLLRPVTTRCGHTMCASCMEQWAEISVSRQMAIVGLDDTSPVTLLPSQMESRCPMCRTLTTASDDESRARELRRKYPRGYTQREQEERLKVDEDLADIETLTLYIGNHHSIVRSDPGDSKNIHNWQFFVKPSRTDIIEEVQIFLVGLLAAGSRE